MHGSSPKQTALLQLQFLTWSGSSETVGGGGAVNTLSILGRLGRLGRAGKCEHTKDVVNYVTDLVLLCLLWC